jgi:hypothetical protein
MSAEGYPVEFVVVSDANADDFVERTTHRIFQDDASGKPAWKEMDAGAVKHDTFVYAKDGERLLYWDASSESFGNWAADIRAVVEAQGK